MNRRRHDLVLLGLLLGGQCRTHLPGSALFVGGDAAGDDQSYPASGALGVERSHPLETALSFLEAHVHGSHEHAVRQGDEAEVEGFQ